MIISIHAPREGSDVAWKQTEIAKACISIHAPREGSDRRGLSIEKFNFSISIHAPREGSDQFAVPPQGSLFDFYPRSP